MKSSLVGNGSIYLAHSLLTCKGLTVRRTNMPSKTCPYCHKKIAVATTKASIREHTAKCAPEHQARNDQNCGADHLPPAPWIFRCYYCDASFDYTMQYYQHVVAAHPEHPPCPGAVTSSAAAANQPFVFVVPESAMAPLAGLYRDGNEADDEKEEKIRNDIPVKE